MKKEKENMMRKINAGVNKSKSPGHYNKNYMDDIPEKGTTLKMGQQEQPILPAWYSTLKRQVGGK
jgi:hypothetical protein